MTLDARLLKWGEDWARARGMLMDELGEVDHDAPHTVTTSKSGFTVGGALNGALGDAPWPLFTLTPLQFWLWAHAVDTGRTDSQRCPDCEGGRRWRCVWTNYIDDMELARSESAARSESLGVPHRVARGTDEAGRSIIDVLKGDPCPTCTGPAVECITCFGRLHPDYSCACNGSGTVPGEALGYISRPLARVVCEALPRVAKPNTCHAYKDAAERFADRHDGVIRRRTDGTPGTKEPGPGWVVEYRCSPGDPAARATLEVHANELMHVGDPLGQALALWLHGVPCEACSGSGEQAVDEGTRAVIRTSAAMLAEVSEHLAATHANSFVRAFGEVDEGMKPVVASEAAADMLRMAAVCPCCHGDGTALGAYVAAQLEGEAQRIEAARESAYRTAFRQELQCEPR